MTWPPAATTAPLRLWPQLLREAGWRQGLAQAGLTLLGSLLEVSGLGLGVAVLLAPERLGLARQTAIGLLVALLVGRALAQALSTILAERLRTGFTDRLRQDLLAQVVRAPSEQLDRIGRGDLLGLLSSDIQRSVLALDQGVRTLQGLVSLLIYGTGVVAAGQSHTWPLLLGLGAAALAALLQRSGAWQLGRLQTQLNGALHRTLGDGLHGLKAIRAATAEDWLLQRFARETAQFRQVLRTTVRRQALFSALRDGLVVAVVGLWLLLAGRGLGPDAIATTLLLAGRASGALSSVISSWRLCQGALPGYGELRRLRQLLGSPRPRLAPQMTTPLPGPIRAVSFRSAGQPFRLVRGELLVVSGPSGSGKTTLLDRFCGLLGATDSQWVLEAGRERLPLQGGPDLDRWRHCIGYAPQEAVLFEGSLRENLLLASGANIPDARLEDWLQRLGLAHLLERPGGLDAQLNLALDCLSGGEQRRLGLIRTWLQDRPVEVLDEPTAWLDATSAAQVREILMERSRQRLVLVSSHDPDLVAAAAQHLVLNDTQPSRQRIPS